MFDKRRSDGELLTLPGKVIKLCKFNIFTASKEEGTEEGTVSYY